MADKYADLQANEEAAHKAFDDAVRMLRGAKAEVKRAEEAFQKANMKYAEAHAKRIIFESQRGK